VKRLLAFLVVLAASACGPAAGDAPPSITPSSTDSSACDQTHQGWVVHHAEGLCLSTPSRWAFTDQSPAPLLVSPPILFAMGTWGFPAGGDCAPTRALEDLPEDGMFLWLFEYVDPQRDPHDFRRRPEHFDLGQLQGPFECIGRKTYLILFRQHGRFFQIHTVLGSKAPASLRQQVLASLDSLVVEPPS
jgi:hypothetical protein